MATDTTAMVRSATLVQLVDALAEDIFGRHDDDAGRRWFRCTKCRGDADGTSAGTALMINEQRWSCTRCRHQGTRWALERAVLEDAVVLDRLLFAMEVAS